MFKTELEDILKEYDVNIFHEMGFMGGKLDYIRETLQINDITLLLIMDQRQWKEVCALYALYRIISILNWYHIHSLQKWIKKYLQIHNNQYPTDWKWEFTSDIFKQYKLHLATYEMSRRLDSEEIEEYNKKQSLVTLVGKDLDPIKEEEEEEKVIFPNKVVSSNITEEKTTTYKPNKFINRTKLDVTQYP